MRLAWGWGTVAGMAFFGPLLTWLTNVGELAAWAFLVPLQAVFVGAFVAGVVAWGDRPWRPVVAVVWWVGLEAVRSAVPFGGFPWGVLGYTQHDGGLLLPAARVVGVLGLSALCAGIAACVEEVVQRAARDTARAGIEPALARLRGPLVGVVALLAAAVLVGIDTPAPSERVVDVAGIQGLDEAGQGRTLPRSLDVADKMVATTARLADDPAGLPDLVVWPENAVDGDPARLPELRERVLASLRLLEGTPLLAGVITDGPREGTFRNTMVHFGPDGQRRDAYVKRKLVPFGEYVPFREALDWVPPLRRVPSDGVPGDSPGVLDIAGARVGTVICFEVIFPELVHSQVRRGAELLVVATNNVSFGRSAASDQHIAFSQLRAVETGRWVVHAALSGSSAIVDPDGRVHQQTGLFEQAVIRREIPLVQGRTPALWLSGLIAWSAVALSTAGVLWVGWSSRRQRRNPARALPPDGGSRALHVPGAGHDADR